MGPQQFPAADHELIRDIATLSNRHLLADNVAANGHQSVKSRTEHRSSWIDPQNASDGLLFPPSIDRKSYS